MKFKDLLMYIGIVGSIAAILTISQLLTSKTVRPHSAREFAQTSVMITDITEHGGGSGVILQSTRTQSFILTNAHICEHMLEGGVVKTDFKKGYINSVTISRLYDLCLLSVNENFRVNTVVSDNDPSPYDKATVVGHPNLLPTIITNGYFTQIMIEVEQLLIPCTPQDIGGPNFEVCLQLGGIPFIKIHKEQLVSATIMPGSSGSPVFNSTGEIAGLVYAIPGASPEFGYAYIVKHSDIVDFLKNEIKKLPILKVSTP